MYISQEIFRDNLGTPEHDFRFFQKSLIVRVIGSCNCITCVANRDSCIVGVVAVFFVWCLLFFSNSKFSVRSTTIKRFKNLPSLVTALIDVQFAYYNRRFKISRRNFLNNSLFSFHSRDMWNYLDMGIVFIYVVILVCRIATFIIGGDAFHNRWLEIANYSYGFNTLFLTLRFSSILELSSVVGPLQLALFQMLRDLLIILIQFAFVIVAFSMAITKCYTAEKSYTIPQDSKSIYTE